MDKKIQAIIESQNSIMEIKKLSMWMGVSITVAFFLVAFLILFVAYHAKTK